MRRQQKIIYLLIGVVSLIFALFFISIGNWNVSPRHLPDRQVVIFKNTDSLTALASKLESYHIINSSFSFRIYVLTHGIKIVPGDYSFTDPASITTIAKRLATGDFELSRLTIPEGSNRFDIAKICAQKISGCDSSEFLKETTDLEGYLFPDTYFFTPQATTSVVVSKLHDTYVQMIEPLKGDIAASGKSEKEIITMASILESEARQKETMQKVAGILWKRISIGMALQVDSAFVYVNGKTSADLTLKDLKINSPYNTYIHRGLPPTPIANPGLVAIDAALHPIATDNLYFLTGDDGTMYYAKTLAEHAENKRKYIK